MVCKHPLAWTLLGYGVGIKPNHKAKVSLTKTIGKELIMKKLFVAVVIIISLGMSLPSHAQKFYGGLMGGLNFADLDIVGDGEEQEVGARTLYGFGVVFGVTLNDYMAIQVEPKYMQKGGTLIHSDSDPEFDIKAEYIEVPILIKASMGDRIRPYVLAGPTFGYLMSASVKGEVEEMGLTFEADWKDVSKDFEMALTFGGGVSMQVGRGSIFLDGRYCLGLVNLNEGGTVEFRAGDLVMTEEVREDDEFSTKGFQIMLGYTLPLGPK